MEVSISGALHPDAQGYRATINSYQYGDALAIAQIADRLGRKAVAERFRAKATELKRLVQGKLWDPAARFFKVLPRGENTRLSDARELHGFTPWYFNLSDADKSVAWNYEQDAVSRRDYLDLLKIYAQSHRLKRKDGRVSPWIDENLNPPTAPGSPAPG